MSQPILLPISGEMIPLLAQDRRSASNWTQALTLVLSLLVIAATLYQMRAIDPHQIVSLVPVTLHFWALFALGIMAGPLSEFYIFNKLWKVGAAALGALTRKLIYNELLLGYLGEAWFYAWARRSCRIEGSPFGAVKDVAVLSAAAGNLMTLVLVLLAIPFLDLLSLGQYGDAGAWSLVFVVATSLAMMIWRKSLFSLTRNELRMVFAVHVGRIVATTLISSALWHLVLPDVSLGWWVMLAAVRLLISRLPFLPNKDIAFAGVAVLVVGQEAQISELMAMMAGLILCANLCLGLGFAVSDLIKGERRRASKA
ncbi:hypothetical protein [Stakelama pacifica]|uniref:Lysylphosphatidylglycerol synthase-like protein n=1 Tax=Stakelama pacifica TaxID=517720 RepID=A0A4V3BSJ8_9SPHN|nr:hypothetical protein [Stakelama pacifica]TDN78968.1 hypothetical protein EV664_1144 [Stakelama pacifica]GGO98987.1 hypothetical protein GCM10011329_31460 [Stakelama pacifica]